ncbi:MAG: hypothetical protein J5J00_09190 [Deltaproteobacteria bacterium]|nr:hypothetical protein [Deltaproteobacteria bacterium]
MQLRFVLGLLSLSVLVFLISTTPSYARSKVIYGQPLDEKTTQAIEQDLNNGDLNAALERACEAIEAKTEDRIVHVKLELSLRLSELLTKRNFKFDRSLFGCSVGFLLAGYHPAFMDDGNRDSYNLLLKRALDLLSTALTKESSNLACSVALHLPHFQISKAINAKPLHEQQTYKEEIASAMTSLLFDDDRDCREGAADLIMSLGILDPEVELVLLKAAQSPLPNKNIYFALLKSSGYSPSHLPIIMNGVASDDEQCMIRAVQGLSVLAKRDLSARANLLQCALGDDKAASLCGGWVFLMTDLKDDEKSKLREALAQGRRGAVLALAREPVRTEKQLEQLRIEASKAKGSFKSDILRHLIAVGNVDEQVIVALFDSEQSAHFNLITLEKLGPAARPYLKIVTRAVLRDGYNLMRHELFKLTGLFRTSNADLAEWTTLFDEVLRIIPPDELHNAAVVGIQISRVEGGRVEIITKLLENPSPTHRYAALSAMKECDLQAKKQRERLQELLGTTSDHETRMAILGLLYRYESGVARKECTSG